MACQFPIKEKIKSELELHLESEGWEHLYNYNPEKGVFKDGKWISQKDEIVSRLRENPRFQDVRIEDQAYDKDGNLISTHKAVYVKLTPSL